MIDTRTIINAARRYRDPQELLAIVKECGTLFWSEVLICTLIGEQLFYEMYDRCEERGELRFNNKHNLKEAAKCYDKVDAWIGNTPAMALVGDFAIQVHKRLEKQLTDLYITFKVYLERKGQTDCGYKAHVLVATTIIRLSIDLFDNFFDIYKDKCGLDLRNDYIQTRVGIANTYVQKFCNDLLKPEKNGLEPTKNYASVQAFNAFTDKLLDSDTLDAAGLRALQLNNDNKFVLEAEEEMRKLKENTNTNNQ